MLADALEHLVRGIVEYPDDVSVRLRAGRGDRPANTLSVRVNPQDMGRVIGRSGRTATALRTVISALDSGRAVRIDFVDVGHR